MANSVSPYPPVVVDPASANQLATAQTLAQPNQIPATTQVPTGAVVATSSPAASDIELSSADEATLNAMKVGQDPAAAASDSSLSIAQVSPYPTSTAAVQLPSNTNQVVAPLTQNNNSSSVAEMFFAAKGSYYLVQYPTNSGKGLYAVEGLNKFDYAAQDATTQQQRQQQSKVISDQTSILNSALNQVQLPANNVDSTSFSDVA